VLFERLRSAVNAVKETLGEIARSYDASRWTISRLGS
jgi:hypothetical protein